MQESHIATAARQAQPLYFPSASPSLFGWLHRPPGESRDIGVVLCKPFGWEAMSSHMSLRVFAEELSASGLPTLRFDYTGAGDSRDLDLSANQVDTWLQDIDAAIAELVRLTSVRNVCLLGFRLGALLAALAAGRNAAVSAVAAVAPVVSGKVYLSELRTLRLAEAQRMQVLSPSSGTAQAPSGGAVEVSGFMLNAATVAALKGIDLTNVEAGRARYLVIDRTDMPVARRWAEKLGGAGVSVEHHALPGFVEMMMRPAESTEVPVAMLEAVRDWLKGLPGLQVAGSDAARAGARELPLHEPGSAAPLREQPVFFGSEPRLFGILTQPPVADSRPRRGVILLNSGADYHIGPRRMYVSLARRWARSGCYVLRIDISGLGDSGAHPGCASNQIFPPGAIDDIRQAVETMRSVYGVSELTLSGVCAGAFHSLRAAVAQLPVERIMMVNPLNYFWQEDMTFDTVQDWEMLYKPAAYRRQLFQLQAWKRVLFGQVNLWRILTVYFQRPLFAVQARVRKVARWMHIRLKRDLAGELEQLVKRGVDVVFVFSKGEAGLQLLQTLCGLSAEDLGRRYRLHVVEGADHFLTRADSREVVSQVLSEELQSRQG
jgi:alpha-beta hydrolase superfamily lysophospholipase